MQTALEAHLSIHIYLHQAGGLTYKLARLEIGLRWEGPFHEQCGLGISEVLDKRDILTKFGATTP